MCQATTELLLRVNGVQAAFGAELGLASPRADEVRHGDPYRQDACFLDANTWHPADRTGHRSVLGGLDLVRRWRPKRTYLVHYSGYEDRDRPEEPIHGPMDLPRLRRELRRVAPELDVQPAVHGMILGDDVPWPGD